jgi:phospholipid/cholesterol/gamma-HCH transport system substrate-binding protein
MDVGYKQEVTVGLLVIAGVVLFIVVGVWLGGGSLFGDEDEYWKIRFDHAGNLKKSSSVRVSGVAVGRVEDIRLDAASRKALVWISLRDEIQPRADALAEVVSVGLVGDAAIDLDPGTAAQPLRHDQVIPGSVEEGFTTRAEALGDRADSVMIGLQEFANKETAQQLRETMTALQATLAATERTMRLYGNPNRGPSAELTRTLESYRALGARLDSTLASPGLQAALGRSDSLTQSLDRMTMQLAATSARLDTVLLNVNQGRGTIGKFATDTGLYTDLRDVSAGLKGLLAELRKNPGKIGVTVKVF